MTINQTTNEEKTKKTKTSPRTKKEISWKYIPISSGFGLAWILNCPDRVGSFDFDDFIPIASMRIDEQTGEIQYLASLHDGRNHKDKPKWVSIGQKIKLCDYNCRATIEQFIQMPSKEQELLSNIKRDIE